ncbi:hypothetical protein BHE74_00059035, partial [Ensete ventricosum]
PTSELGRVDHARNASPLRFQQIGHPSVRARRLRVRARQNRAREFVIGLGPVRLPPLSEEGPPREKLVRQAPSKEPVVASRRRASKIGPSRRFGGREVRLVTVLPLPPRANCRLCCPDVARHDKMTPLSAGRRRLGTQAKRNERRKSDDEIE